MNSYPDLSQQDSRSRTQPWTSFVLWLFLSLLAGLARVPYIMELTRAAGGVVDPIRLLSGILSEHLFLPAIAICIALVLGPRVGLGFSGARNTKGRWKSTLIYAAVCGVLVGAACAFMGGRLESSMISGVPDSARRVADVARQMDPWKMALASFSAGLTEELLFRAGAMTLFVWLIAKVIGRQPPGAGVLWLGNLLAAVLFGLAHLGNVAVLSVPITMSLIYYVTIVNGTAGIVFGWLYWRRGIGTAILAHVMADLVLKVILPRLGPA